MSAVYRNLGEGKEVELAIATFGIDMFEKAKQLLGELDLLGVV